MNDYRLKMLSGRAFFTTRNIILLCVLLQNAGYTLVRKYSTITENVSSKEILLVAEMIKMAAAIWFTVTDREKSDAQGQGVDKLIWLIQNSGKMLVLAAIYGMSKRHHPPPSHLLLHPLISSPVIYVLRYHEHSFFRCLAIHWCRRVHHLCTIEDIDYCRVLCVDIENEFVLDPLACFGLVGLGMYLSRFTDLYR